MRGDDDHPEKEKDGRMDMNRPTLLAAIESAVSGHPEIAAAYLYGSASRGTATPLSDVDLGLLFRESNGSFRERLATAVRFGSAIAHDLSGVRVDARDLDDLPLVIVGAVLTDGELVVSNDEERRVAFERDTRLRYFDFLPIHVLGDDRASLEEVFARVERSGTVDCTYCMPYEDHLPVWIARGLRGGLDQIWPSVRHYD